MSGINSIHDLSAIQKRIIVNKSLQHQIPVHRIAILVGIPIRVINEYISFILNNKQEQELFLPKELHATNKMKFKEITPPRSYYGHLNGPEQEMMIASDWMPTYSNLFIEAERIYNYSDRLSFSERLAIQI